MKLQGKKRFWIFEECFWEQIDEERRSTGYRTTGCHAVLSRELMQSEHSWWYLSCSLVLPLFGHRLLTEKTREPGRNILLKTMKKHKIWYFMFTEMYIQLNVNTF